MTTSANAYEYAIVGGGVAGSYAQWRLANAGKSVALFEMSDRIGGRLYSQTPPGMPQLRAELGGMRYLSTQPFIVNLIAQLGLPTAPFSIGGPNNLAYLRAHRFPVGSFTDPADVPYFVAPSEAGMNPGQILVHAITTLVPNALNYTPEQWEIAKQTLEFNGRKLYEWGFWDAIYQVMSSEAYALLLDGGGYESLADNWNAAEACQHLLADFPSTANYMHLVDGYQTLPEMLAEQSNAPIFFNRELISIQPGTQTAWTLLFKDAAESFAVDAANVILALPQSPLKKVLNASQLPDVPLIERTLLDTVTPMPAIKLFLGFSNAWWEKLNLDSGRSVTDLPLRQVYYFGQDQTDGDALLMATYADGRTESFWRYLLSFDGSSKQLLTQVDPNSALANEVVRQLSLMHGIAVPQPLWMSFVDWHVEPFRAGWHFWNAGLNVGKTIGNIRQPFANLPLYVCGEAYSNEQGWVEGALNSTELVLRMADPSLPIPSWLQGVYLGP